MDKSDACKNCNASYILIGTTNYTNCISKLRLSSKESGWNSVLLSIIKNNMCLIKHAEKGDSSGRWSVRMFRGNSHYLQSRNRVLENDN